MPCKSAAAPVPRQTKGLAVAEMMSRRRRSPGIILFTDKLKLLYVNQEALIFNECLNHLSGNGNRCDGVFSPVIIGLCGELTRLKEENPAVTESENLQLRRVVGSQSGPILLRAFGIPTAGSLLVLMEKLKEQQRADLTFQSEWHLTDRERTIIHCLSAGMTNKEIANNLQLSEYTVKDHFKHIMVKTGVTTRTAVALVAFRKAGLHGHKAQCCTCGNGDRGTVAESLKASHSGPYQGYSTGAGGLRRYRKLTPITVDMPPGTA